MTIAKLRSKSYSDKTPSYTSLPSWRTLIYNVRQEKNTQGSHLNITSRKKSTGRLPAPTFKLWNFLLSSLMKALAKVAEVKNLVRFSWDSIAMPEHANNTLSPTDDHNVIM